MRVLLVSSYELGHQPLHVASPAAALLAAGHEVRALDLAVEGWDTALARWAEAVAFSVPMHTAMRLALAAAGSIRELRPGLPVCLYGLYAGAGAELTLAGVADRLITGEYEPALLRWVDGLGGPEPSGADRAVSVEMGRGRFGLPARRFLPPLGRYAHLAVDGELRPVGYVEASHGCAHRCRHCPVPVVYDGRTRIVAVDAVLADVAQLVAAGARHITYGDPDFLNGAHHSLRVVRAVHERFPQLTFDITTKVSHILAHEGIWEELAAAGCLFVVSAFESVNDEILRRLDKGHTTTDAAAAVALLRTHGIEIRPSFLPFTPWTTLDDVVDLLDFVAAHDLVANVDPVQYAIRLLLPDGSLLLGHPDLAAHLGAYDRERLSWAWRAADPAVDEVQTELASLIEASAASGEAIGATFQRVRELVHRRAGRALPAPTVAGPDRPRLTESWFCCAEPTELQRSPLRTAAAQAGGGVAVVEAQG